MTAPQSVIDVSTVLRELGVLTRDIADEVPPEQSAGDLFLDAMRCPEKLQKCLDCLFPAEIPLSQPFFDQLSEFQRWIHFSNNGDEAIGLIWSEAMRRLSQPQQEELLTAFAQQQGHVFFETSRSVWIVARDHELSARFLARWFPTLLQAVERDWMQEDVWKTIRTVCTTYHQAAVKVLQEYLTEPDARRDNITGYILGVLRSQPLAEEWATEYRKIEDAYRESGEYSRRAVFDWSWVTTARDRELTKDEFDHLIARSKRSIDDLNNLLCVVCRLIQFHSLPSTLLEQAVRWVGETISPTLSSDTKYCVVRAATHLYDASQHNDPAINSPSWILALQPVPREDRRTWECIGNFLCGVLRKDAEQLPSILTSLCSTSARTIHDLMTDRGLRHLLHELGKHDVVPLIATLALSTDTATRRLGLFLFNELDIDELPSLVINSSDGLVIQLLFYEAQRTVLSPEAVGRILAGIVSAMEKTSSAFQEQLLDQLRLQCRNSSGCRQELERLSKNHPFVATVMKDLADYFDALRQAHEAGINDMEVAGVRKAARQHRRRFSKQVSDSVKMTSPFLDIMKHVSLLYGKASSQFIDGVLRDATPLVQMSHSMELPMVDLFDPEGMALRRLHASTMISRLVGGLDSESETPYEH